MTRDEALQLIGASPNDTSEEIRHKYAGALADVRLRLASAPSARLRELFAGKLRSLEQAGAALDQGSSDATFYPVNAPIAAVSVSLRDEVTSVAERPPAKSTRPHRIVPGEGSASTHVAREAPLLRALGRALLTSRGVFFLIMLGAFVGVLIGAGRTVWHALFGNGASQTNAGLAPVPRPTADADSAAITYPWLFEVDFARADDSRRPPVMRRAGCRLTYAFRRATSRPGGTSLGLLNADGMLLDSDGERCMADSIAVALPDSFSVQAVGCPDLYLGMSDVLDSLGGSYRGPRSRYEFWLGDRPARSLEFALRTDGAWSLRRTLGGTTQVLVPPKSSGRSHQSECVTMGMQFRGGTLQLTLDDSVLARAPIDSVPRTVIRLGTEHRARYEVLRSLRALRPSQ